jgi:hypothetical protein
MDYSFGAIARGNTLSTVEHRNGTFLLACVRGDLATIGIENIKGRFASLARADEAAAMGLAAAAPTTVAKSVAVALIEGDHAYVCCARGGTAYRQRDGEVSAVTGMLQIAPGDDLIIGSGPLTLVDATFPTPAVRQSSFANDTLDDDLKMAIARLTLTTGLAVAAARRCR